MAADRPALPEETPLLHRRVALRQLRRQLLYVARSLTTVLLVGLLLSSVAVSLQARRDEARNADAAIVVAPAVPPERLIERSFDLYRRGFARELLVIGSGSEGLRMALIEQGAGEEAVIAVAGEGGETAQLRVAAEMARASGATTVVVVGEGAEMLRWLKQVSDCGLRPYGAPVPMEGPGVVELLAASGRYWRYLLLQQ
jgi:hypothetical protein